MGAWKISNCGAVFLSFVFVAFGQNVDEKKRTYFENISIDSEGHVCYYEPIGTKGLNRIEYRTNGKSELDIFFENESVRVNVQLTDFNNDDRVDLIYIMNENIKRKVIQKIDFYRGPEYLEHLKRHYKHAFITATHPLIKNRADEIQRAKEIEEELERLNKQRISRQEIGAYRADIQFRQSDTPELSQAFAASDTLNSAVRTVLSGDYRILSRPPEITIRYYEEINRLLEINPSSRTYGVK